MVSPTSQTAIAVARHIGLGLVIVVGVAAPVTALAEEAGLRGFMQAPLFGLRSSVVHLGSPLSRITSVPLLLAAVVAACVSAIGFVILARLTASKRPLPGKAGAAV